MAERLLQALSELGESLQDPQLLQLCSERKVASHTRDRGGGVGVGEGGGARDLTPAQEMPPSPPSEFPCLYI